MVIIIKKIIVIFIIIVLRIIYINAEMHDYYKIKLDSYQNKYIYSLSSPRGRILDTNGKVIVDNIKKRVIVYNKINNVSIKQELLIAKKLSKYINDNLRLTKKEIATYLIDKNGDLKIYLLSDDYDKYKKGVFSYNEIKTIAINNIINDEKKLNLSESEKKIAKIYNLMNKDYYFDKKIIFKDISDDLYFEIIGENIPGISGEYIYERYYPYGNILKSILGSVGKITKENKDEYIKEGYILSDEVGLSYLEKVYEKKLRGTKAEYIVKKDGSIKKIKKEKQGEDIYLNIDMNIESKLSEILKKHIKNSMGKYNTEYYDTSYVLIGKPTGQIIAALGLKIKGDEFIDVTSDIINSSFVVGSVVKAASNTVAYHENVIIPGKKIKDSCVKLYLNTKKCSFSNLGYIDDISALEKSSNYYQFINAIRVMGYNYKYNMKINATTSDFNKYRDIFSSYGLGSKTNIDLPEEKVGIKGNIVSTDLLLNLSIGQYDAYTPVQLLSYVNTLATKGYRYNLSLKKGDNNIIDKVDLKDEYMERIHMGLNKVITSGTGKGYIKNNDGAGKTGTSETLYDKDNDGIYETNSTSTAFIGFAPYKSPIYTFAIISPNISSNIKKGIYKVPINRYIMHDLTDFLFEN